MLITATNIRADVSVSEQLSEEQSWHLIVCCKISWLGLPGLNNLSYVSKTSLNCSLLQRLLKLLLWGAQQRISCCRGSCSRKLKGSKLQNKSAGLSSKEEKGFFCGDRPLATAGSVARSAQVFKLQKALRKYLSVVRTFLLEMFKLQSQTAGV